MARCVKPFAEAKIAYAWVVHPLCIGCGPLLFRVNAASFTPARWFNVLPRRRPPPVSFLPYFLGTVRAVIKGITTMDFIAHITVGHVISAFLVCVLLREILITVADFLPDSLAGPNGWMIDTSDDLGKND